MVNPIAQMFTQAGSKFLDTMAGQHGQTFANRILRPFQDFDTPWGKGPYWNPDTMASAETQTTRARWNETIRSARKHGVHPLFALGMAPPGGATGPVMSPHRGGTGQGQAQPLQRRLTAAQLRESAARAQKDEAMASYYASQAARMKQAPGGAPTETSVSTAPDIRAPGISKGSKAIRGPYGGVYRVPKGVSPQEDWEGVVGEIADWTVGPLLGMRMYADRQRRMQRVRNQVQAARRHRSAQRNLRRSRRSRFNRWLRR